MWLALMQLDARALIELIVGPVGALAVLSVSCVVLYRMYRSKEAECMKLLEENRRLWAEKVDDAGETTKIARAYIELRDRELKGADGQ